MALDPDDYVSGPGEWVATGDDYGNHHAGGYATVDAFLAMCDSCFGERPVLTHRWKGTDDVCVDADDRVVLRWVPATVPETPRAPSRSFTVRLGEHADDETLNAVFSELRGVVIDVDGERMVFHRFDSTLSGHIFVCGVPYPPTPPLDASTEVEITADTVLTVL